MSGHHHVILDQFSENVRAHEFSLALNKSLIIDHYTAVVARVDTIM